MRDAEISSWRQWVTGLMVAGLVIGTAGGPLVGQETDDAEEGPQQVIIERTPVQLRDPKTYSVSLSLEPIREIDLVAVADGVTGAVQVQLGGAASRQAEAVRLDSAERQLELERAKALFRVAQAEQRATSGGDANAVEAAEGRLEAARAELRLAEHRLDATVVRFPFDGKVMGVHVVPGQFVRAGQPLVTLADTSKMRVAIPVDRTAVNEGDTVDIKIETDTVQAKVETIVPLKAEFEPLRELFVSVATAVLVLENGDGKLKAGQTVFADMIPRQPVMEVPTSTLANMEEGGRKVQVIRDGFVRDIPVKLLGQVGEEHVFVSGRFSAADELVLSSSEVLLDGARAVPAGAEIPTEEDEGAGPAGRRRGSRF
ncbi:Multidrug resistance protein MdtN [Maioricimonas rarisocia]|uniref:Multidrug resistance protein MdtN n=1 Tax=Maioricimonas rarisocia TaxID=2528026 RepID=A0A517Z3P9_9PLAN|nr:HlyD family efflux transporter periplasmic adaptor subunit [Maioricimonas rarisocia]QDU37055.1 Multidrug resistance protein MdtN [Maioricimonas rarisocia]